MVKIFHDVLGIKKKDLVFVFRDTISKQFYVNTVVNCEENFIHDRGIPVHKLEN